LFRCELVGCEGSSRYVSRYVSEVVCDCSGVRESGAAAADPDRDTMMLTISGSGEPHGVFSFDDRSLYNSVNASNTTLSLTIHRLAGTIGQYFSCLTRLFVR